MQDFIIAINAEIRACNNEIQIGELQKLEAQQNILNQKSAITKLEMQKKTVSDMQKEKIYDGPCLLGAYMVSVM